MAIRRHTNAGPMWTFGRLNAITIELLSIELVPKRTARRHRLMRRQRTDRHFLWDTSAVTIIAPPERRSRAQHFEL